MGDQSPPERTNPVQKWRFSPPKELSPKVDNLTFDDECYDSQKKMLDTGFVAPDPTIAASTQQSDFKTSHDGAQSHRNAEASGAIVFQDIVAKSPTTPRMMGYQN
jgi:hypothetical protein